MLNSKLDRSNMEEVSDIEDGSWEVKAIWGVAKASSGTW